MDREDNKLWKLTKAMNDEDTKSSPVMIQRDQETVTGKSAANCFIDSYEQVSNIMTPNNRKQQVHDEIKNHQTDQDPPEHINCPFNTKEFEEALKTLKDKKSPGPDKITNEMLEHLGTKAKSKLLGIFNNSWKTGHVPQSWREADMVPIHKKGKRPSKFRQLPSYQPHQLCGQTHGKNEQHSPGMAPGEEQHHHSRAGRLSAAPIHCGPGDALCPEDRGWLPG